MIETIFRDNVNIPIKDMGQGQQMTDNNDINRDTKSRRHEIKMKLKRLIKLKENIACERPTSIVLNNSNIYCRANKE